MYLTQRLYDWHGISVMGFLFHFIHTPSNISLFIFFSPISFLPYNN